MRKAMTIITQVLIFTVAWFVMTPDTLEDNTYVFGLLGSYDLVRGNAIWVMIGAGVLSVLNIWLWWPKTQVTTPSESSPAESTKGAEVKEIKSEENDPIVPKMD